MDHLLVVANLTNATLASDSGDDIFELHKLKLTF